jgi:hypothetical protein
MRPITEAENIEFCPETSRHQKNENAYGQIFN